MERRYDPEKAFWDMIGPEPDVGGADEELQADVVVCGGGIAGVAAVRAAAEAGARVLLLEKCGSVQGRSGAFGVIGFPGAERRGRGFTERRRQIVAEMIKEGGNRGDYGILRYWADHSGQDLSWYIEPMGGLCVLERTEDTPPEGVDFWLQPARYPLPAHYDPEREYYPTYQGVWQFRPGGHMPVLKRNFQAALDTGLVQARFFTPAVKLLRENGRVTGVLAQNRDGTVLRAAARLGVVLATGDYSGDDDMLYYYAPQTRLCPRLYNGRDAFGRMANSGDGHRMGVWAGGKLEEPPHAYVAHSMGGPLGINAYLQLDAFGRRFMNEDVGGMQMEYKLERLPGHVSWQFFDATWPEHAADYSVIHGTVSHVLDRQAQREGRVNRTLGKMDGYTGVEDVEKEAAAGRLLKADSLEELIARTGLPAETALASVRRYNELCARGDDEDFGKAPGRLFPVTQAPFYACRLTPAPLLVTVSGLDSDRQAHVLDTDGVPIPGLYAAGNVQGGRFGAEDPSMFPGTSHSIALCFGRLAGRNAAAGI